MSTSTMRILNYSLAGVGALVMIGGYFLLPDNLKWLTWVGFVLIIASAFFDPRGRGLAKVWGPRGDAADAEDGSAPPTTKRKGLINRGDEDG